jgi:hypothetical protein
MPNWCYNKVTVRFDKENEPTLRESISTDKELFMQFVPRPKEYDEGEAWYGWNISNWGTKWDATPYDIEWGENEVKFRLETAWAPPIKFYEELHGMGYDVEAYYQEEGMAFVGLFYNGDDDYYEYGDMNADQMEDSLPSWVEDEFGLISYTRDNEESEEEQEMFEFEAQLEKTEWYPGKIKPVRGGLYEVKSKAWPWEHKDTWENGKWLSGDKITEWRGITQAQFLSIAIDELNKAIDE